MTSERREICCVGRLQQETRRPRAIRLRMAVTTRQASSLCAGSVAMEARWELRSGDGVSAALCNLPKEEHDEDTRHPSRALRGVHYGDWLGIGKVGLGDEGVAVHSSLRGKLERRWCALLRRTANGRRVPANLRVHEDPRLTDRILRAV